MGFSVNYKGRAWMITCQKKNFQNLNIQGYENPEILAKSLSEIWENSGKSGDRVCGIVVCKSKEGLYHAHVACYGNSTTLGCVAKIFGNAHTEPQLAGKKRLKAYLLKEDEFAEKGEEILFEYGLENIQDNKGSRSDIDEVALMIEAGATPNEIFTKGFRYRKYEKMIMAAYVDKRIKEASLHKNMHCEWHTGESGSGKSYTYIKLCEEYGKENIYFLNDLSTGGLDMYMEQGAPRILFIDEVKPLDITYKQMLMLTDAYSSAQTHSRFHNTLNLWDKVYVTSIYSIEEFYKELVPEEKRNTESFEQLRRRFHKVVYHYKNLAGEYKQTECEMQAYKSINYLIDKSLIAEVRVSDRVAKSLDEFSN